MFNSKILSYLSFIFSSTVISNTVVFLLLYFKFSSVQSLRQVWLFVTPWTAALQPPCPSLSSGVCSNACPLSQWCHPTFSSSIIPFSSCLQSFPAYGSFPKSQLFTSGGQSIGASASASVLPMNIQGWSPLRWTSLISVQSKGLSRVFPRPQFVNINSLDLSAYPIQPLVFL